MLAGYSFGGVVAFEMAQQLAKAGEKVALLAMLDSYTHPRSWPLDSRIGVLWRRIANQASIAATVPARQTVAYIARRLGDMGRNLRRHGRPTRPRPFEIDAGLPLAVRRVIECGESAWARYQPQFYPGKITFLKAGTSVRYPKNPGRIWRKLVGDLEVHTVPGEHLELVGMHAERLARRLSLCVEGALGPDGVE